MIAAFLAGWTLGILSTFAVLGMCRSAADADRREGRSS